MGSHTLDLCQMAPTVNTTPVRYKPIDDTTVHAWYADGIQVVMRQKGFRNSCAVRFEGDEGWVETDDSGDIQVSSPTLLDTRAIQSESWMRPVAHPAEFIACVRSRQTPTAPADALHITHVACHAATIAYHLKRELTFDPAALAFVNDAEANRLIHRSNRAPCPSNPARGYTMSIVALTARLFTHMPRRKAVILPLFAAALFAVRPLAADEAALLRQLAEGTPAEKDSARQTLLVSATAAAIPTLTAQLARPETFDSACLLLEALGLPEADAALRTALTTLDGRELAGVIAALTRRADTAAETAILALVDRPQPVRSAALAYLGKLATPRALAALAAAPQDAITADAMLVAAETLLARGDEKQALALYARVSNDTVWRIISGWPPFVHASPLTPTRAHAVPAALNQPAVWRGTAARLTAQLRTSY